MPEVTAHGVFDACIKKIGDPAFKPEGYNPNTAIWSLYDQHAPRIIAAAVFGMPLTGEFPVVDGRPEVAMVFSRCVAISQPQPDGNWRTDIAVNVKTMDELLRRFGLLE